MSDYRLCDVCGSKAFYDSNLNYGSSPKDYGEPYRIAGEPQFDTPEKCVNWGFRLDHVGDWAVVCNDCAKTHKCVIVPTNPTQEADK